jgi:pimeloyl-ACP methyl ester carboxylesterase
VEPFRIHVADEVLDDLRARLRHTRWPDEIPGIGWGQGTELDWLRRLVSYWANEFDWRAWERKLNALNQFTWDGIHFVHQRAASGGGVPLILTHGWPSSFLDYLDMMPMLGDFDVVVPSLPGYGFSPRPLEVGINYRYVSERWHRLMTELGYSRYGAGGNDFGSGVSTFLAVDHPNSVMGIHLTTLESDLTPKVDDAELSDMERSYLAVSRGWDVTEPGYSAIQSTNAANRRLWTERLPGGTGRIPGREVALVERRHAARRLPLRNAYPVLGHADHHLVDARLLGQSLVPGRPHVRRYAHGVRCLRAPDRSRGRAAALVSGARVQHPALDSLSPRRALRPS